jgi:hypothetical protein
VRERFPRATKPKPVYNGCAKRSIWNPLADLQLEANPINLEGFPRRRTAATNNSNNPLRKASAAKKS